MDAASAGATKVGKHEVTTNDSFVSAVLGPACGTATIVEDNEFDACIEQMALLHNA